MRLDALLAFVPVGANLSMVGGAGVAIPGINIIDLLGQGVGQPPANIIGNAATFGQDPGIGMSRPEIEALVGTTFTTANGATLNVALQAAADQGVGGAYQPGTWVTIGETGYMPVANLVAGATICRLPLLPSIPPNLRPRYLRMLFQPLAGTSFTAGTIACAIITPARDDQANKYAAKNFSVA